MKPLGCRAFARAAAAEKGVLLCVLDSLHSAAPVASGSLSRRIYCLCFVIKQWYPNTLDCLTVQRTGYQLVRSKCAIACECVHHEFCGSVLGCRVDQQSAAAYVAACHVARIIRVDRVDTWHQPAFLGAVCSPCPCCAVLIVIRFACEFDICWVVQAPRTSLVQTEGWMPT